MSGKVKFISAFFLLMGVLWGSLPSYASISFTSITNAANSFVNPDSHLVAMFREALLNTGKQAELAGDHTAYVQTGDIHAEWLRDSSAQVRPYLFFANSDPKIAAFLRAVIARHAKYLHVDPYANAFYEDYTVHEEKFELDSLCYPIILAWTYWKLTGDRSIFTPDLAFGFQRALHTLFLEQDHARNSHYSHADLSGRRGRPVAVTGMIWTGFRPSDDPCYYNFLIPSEMMAVVALKDLQDMEVNGFHDRSMATKAARMAAYVRKGIERFGRVSTPNHGIMYAYEVDGRGNSVLMDDANLPSLLSAPYFGYVDRTDPTYINTRGFVLSTDNPYYFKSTQAEGEGSPHTPSQYIWPLALIAEAMTSSDVPALGVGWNPEQARILNVLLASDTGSHLLHESFNPINPKNYTRDDFGWPNALFAEFILTAVGGMPPLPTQLTYPFGVRRQAHSFQ